MNEEQFDDLAKKALAYDPGAPNELVWNRIKPVRWSWFPTVREILVCGCGSLLALAFLGLRIIHKPEPNLEQNLVIQSAMSSEPQSTLALVSQIDEGPSQTGWHGSLMHARRRGMPDRGGMHL